MAVTRTPLVLALAVTAAVTASAALAGCSSGGGDTAAGAGASAVAADGSGGARAGGPEAADSGGGSGKGPQSAGSAAAPAVKQRVIRTAQLVVAVDGELAPAAAKVRATAEGLGGSVGSETTAFTDAPAPAPVEPDPAQSTSSGAPGSPDGSAPRTDTARPGQSLLVLRVPEASLDRAMTLITGQGGVGREISRSATAQDVTGDLADLQSRVDTQRASVARVRALLAKAGSLQDVVLLESEVTKREAELEALEARRAALADRADLATLTVDLRTAAAAIPEEGENAFLDGLGSGWKAVTASTAVLLTVLGALLPIAVVLALVGGPLLWLRRRRAAGPATPPPAPAPGTTS